MKAITNIGTNTLSSSLKDILPSCNKIDALVGYFYFSGFKDLHAELKDKNIKILVGMDIDSKILEKISTLKDLNLDSHVVDTKITSRSSVKDNYIENFSQIFNDTDYFDNDDSQKAFEIFLNKIQDGSLQIKKTPEANHAKFYILHNDPKLDPENKGTVYMGSSNLTFSGLKGQKEHNLVLKESHYYDEHVIRFEESWNDTENIVLADILSSESFIKDIKKKIWLYALPEPIMMYYKVLHEYFSINNTEEIKTPSKITGGKFSDLKYQKDAIELGVDRIKKFGGVIIADVVGLGKSVIASAIAHNLNLKTIIIAPPHLESQWKDYLSEFEFRGHVYTTGKIEEALARHGNDKDLLIILDEAHKHRNEDTENYKYLHRLCSGHYVMALSATPFNNDPKDIYALIKLFSTPGQSTIRTVENLSMSFHMIFKRYKMVRKDLRKNSTDEKDIHKTKNDLQSIADELRLMIEPLVIRRSRLDLDEIDDYREDLKKQGVAFAKVKDPELLEYNLGGMFDLYVNTLNKIAPENNQKSFIGARYKPASYLRADSDFARKLVENGEDQDGEDLANATAKLQSITQAQTNIAKFMRRLLVRRFESSVGAFNISLKNMIASSEIMLDWYQNRQEVPIFKKGALPDVEDLNEMTDTESEKILESFESRGLIRIPISELQSGFETDLIKDIKLLKEIQKDWSENKKDPKFDFLKSKITKSIENDPNRKIIIFTEFSDTANYIYNMISKSGVKKVFKYSSEDASDENKKIIKSNFDAGLAVENQSHDFDVIIATDAISEGFNLHRAGLVINYDIPYNPTRVIQRVGRINRINKKVFDELYIYNFFPTVTGEKETGTKAISTLKMDLIHNLLGEDTKTLTSDEDLKNYFAKQYKEENIKNEKLSWDAVYKNTWLKIKDDQSILKKINQIPHRSRIARTTTGPGGVVTFAKKSGSYIFAYGQSPDTTKIVSPQIALPLFDEVAKNEISKETTFNFDPIYTMAKAHIFKENTMVSIDTGRRQDALNKIKILQDSHIQAKDLCSDLIKVIRDLDGLPNGVLKDICDISTYKSNPSKAYDDLREMIPNKYIESIFATAEKANDTGKLIVLSEEFIHEKI